ncbi:MAG: UDP-N-acetylmuramate dehydrogenase [Elusimicrobia bacterium]|nr:UDP-N-acetylmuramate dehydrogenase [Elusimicrobiota bacterium]
MMKVIAATMSSSWRSSLKEILPHAKFDEPLSRHTSFRIGGAADAYVEIRDREELRRLVRLARDNHVELLWLGWGSNLLIQDWGFRGVASRLKGEFESIEFLEGSRVRVGAAVRLPQMVTACAQRGLGGDEPLVGVPGTVGGALVMNAGTREGEIGGLVVQVDVFDAGSLSERVLGASEIHFDYRKSDLEGKIVLGCVLQLKQDSRDDIMRRVQQHQQRRLQTQPIHTYNVGSTFKNPPGLFVAKLIEEAGLKGAVHGGARISPMHANFIENFAQAKASDVLALVELARRKVREKFGVELELEMKVVGQA